jgi:hypothetical protein
MGRVSIPGTESVFFFLQTSRPAVESTQPPTQWDQRFFFSFRVAEAKDKNKWRYSSAPIFTFIARTVPLMRFLSLNETDYRRIKLAMFMWPVIGYVL